MRHVITASCMLAVCAAASAGPPAPAGRPATKPAAREMIRLNFPESTEVKMLIDYVSKRLGMNVLYDAAIVKKRFTIISPTEIPKDSLVDLMQSVLKMTGLAMVDGDQAGWKRIIVSQDLPSVAKGPQRDTKALAEAKATAAIMQMFPLRHVRTSAVEQTIKPFLSKSGGNSFSLADRDVIVVTDYAPNLRRIASLIELIDQPGREVKTRFIALKHRDAASLATEVTSLLTQRDTVAGKSTGRTAGRDLALTAEPLTNRIVVISTGDSAAEALKLIELLDVPPKTETRTYRCAHVDPKRIETLLQALMGPEKLKRGYRSAIDAESRSLIVEATADVHERLAAIHEQFDVAPATTTVTYRFEHIQPRRIETLVKSLTDDPTARKLFKSTIDVDSGMMIVTATKDIHERIAGLKKDLDIPEVAAESGNVRFYKLVNATAAEVLATIDAMGSGAEGISGLARRMDISALEAEARKFTGANRPPGPGGDLPKPPAYKPTPKKNGDGKDTKATPDDKGTDEGRKVGKAAAGRTLTAKTPDAIVTADPNTNTLIVVAPPEVQRIYKQLITVLDKRRPQVMIEVTMVTLDTTNNFSLGVEIGGGGDVGSEGRYVSFSSFGLSTPDATTGWLAITPGVGFNGALISSHIFDVVIKALSASGRTTVLSAPKLLVNDNATATLVLQRHLFIGHRVCKSSTGRR